MTSRVSGEASIADLELHGLTTWPLSCNHFHCCPSEDVAAPLTKCAIRVKLVI